MLTILHPEILPHIVELPVGLSPLTVAGEQRIILVIKGPKEALLAAKMKQGFRFYLAPINARGIRTWSIVTAFFDDDLNPLHIWTPLFDGDTTSLLCQLLASETFDVHFFDENNRELLGYCATNKGADTLRPRLADVLFLPFSFELAREYHNQAMAWFLSRSPLDDQQAFEITFHTALVPEDLFIQGLTAQATAFHGSTGPGYTTLEREGEPGKFQERDIVYLLQRVFPTGEIYLNPHIIDDGKEIVDVLVISPSHVLLIQAKDSPNTEQSLQRSISRKMATIEGHVKKAVGQLGGALSYVLAHDPLQLVCGSVQHEISLGARTRWGLIVVKETFDTEYSVYSPPVLELSRNSGVPCLLLDYNELHNFTQHRRSEGEFFATFRRTFEFAVRHNQFPRNRFGLVLSEQNREVMSKKLCDL